MSRCVVYQSGGFTNYGISYRKYSQEELAEMGNRAVTGNEKTINILEHMKNLVTVRIFEEEALNRAIKALEEVQQYRKHGVTLESALNNMCDLAAAENLIEEYRAIGTPEECRAAMEKQQVFNMDKVVEQLKAEKEFSYADFDEYVNEVCPCLDAEYDDFFHRGLERAIDIVKAGGVDGN